MLNISRKGVKQSNMKQKRYRLIALLLALSVWLPLLAACAKTPAGNDETGETTVVTDEPTQPPETTIQWADVPDDKNFDGEDFTILVSGNVTYHDFTYDESDKGTVLDQAIFSRNEKINSYFNISIIVNEIFEFGTSYGTGPGYREMFKHYQAGEGGYDLAMIGTHDVCNLAVKGKLYNLNEMPYIDLSKQWWDQKANEQLSMKGIMFYTTGSLSTIVDQFTFCILFNKKLAEEKQVGDLYEIVNQGKWTLDKWREITMGISEDLNGDDIYNEKDLYGSLVWNDTTLGVINAAGEAVAKLNENGEVELSLYNERTEKMLADYLECAYSKNCFNIQTIDSSVRTATRRNMFMNDQALFWLYNVGDDNNAYRNSETLNYGFLPYFKLDEQQEEYACHIQEGACYFLCVPGLVEDAEKTGMITEAMAAESYYTIRPAYFEKQLVGFYISDTESKDMLDIIFSTRIFDVGAFYQVGDYTRNLMSFFLQKKTDFASFCETYRRVAERSIASINDNIKATIIH